jgi:hypothetical protein
MQHQLEMHHRPVLGTTAIDPSGANNGRAYAASHGGHYGYGSTSSNFATKPLQRPFPIRVSQPGSTTVQHPLTFSGHIHSSCPEQSEHQLRRKTPSGTIDAGYDGSPAHLFRGQPPSKQVILPLAPWQGYGQGMESSARMHSLPGYSLQPIISDSLLTSQNIAVAMNQPSTLGGPSPLDSANFHFGRRDSQLQAGYAHILERLVPSHATYPSSQAFGMQGYYSLLAHSPEGGICCPSAAFPGDDYPFQLDNSLPSSIDSNSGATLRQAYQHISLRPPHGYVRTTANQGSDPFQTNQHPAHMRFEPPGHSAGEMAGNNSCFNIHGPNPHRFQEKVLREAHHTYLELVAQRPMRRTSTTKTKAFIHPKLPRQFSLKGEVPYGFKLSRFGDQGPLTSQGMPKAHSNHRVDPFSASVHGSAQYLDLTHLPPTFQGSNPSSAANPNFNQNQRLLVSTARHLLETLYHLCDQSRWKWIDGMLLGGCLCYGVEDYEGALEWFSKTLSLNPRYVPPQTLTKLLDKSSDFTKLG